uniref:Uncharacterized protein n=1 Tax=Anguilla anguilla TaxID=7936 RepID=A0A0E9W931_ANGAN
MEATPCSNASASNIMPSQKSEGWYSSKAWTNSILMPIILDEMLDVRYLHTFGRLVYVLMKQNTTPHY